MIQLAVKTLDGKNRDFCVPDDITVKNFKEKIANSINITADTQRLIYQGRVLQDDKKLAEYDVNGKTIHVVQRPPPSQRGPSSGASASAGSPPRSTGMSRDGNTFVLGSFTLPVDPSNVNNVTQNVLSGLGDLGRNAHVSTRSSNDGSSVDVHIHLGQIAPPQPQSESQLRVDQARRMIQAACRTIERLENPPANGEEEPSSRGASPMQTTPEDPTTSSTTTTTTSASSTSTSSSSNSSNNTEHRSSSRPSSRPRSPEHPAPTALSDLLTEVMALNERLQPHLHTYQRLMSDDPVFNNEEETRSAQRTFNLVSEVLHYISHAYHNISDLMVDMQQAPPRRLRAPPTMGLGPSHIPPIPMQAQVNMQSGVPGGVPWAPPPPTSTSTSTTNSSTSATSSTTTTSFAASASAPQPGLGGGPGGANHVQTTTLPGGGTASVASSNPYVFMELGPHALTINSISAHVVSTEDGGAPPLSNPAATPAPNTTTANTSTTSSTNTQPSTRPGGPTPSSVPLRGPRLHGPQAVHMQIPVGANFMGPGGPIPVPGGMPGGMGGIPGGMVPPEIMQNILQMVTQQAFPRPPGAQPANSGSRPQAPTSSSSAGPSSTASTTTSRTATSSVPTSTSNPSPQAQRSGNANSSPPGAPPGMRARVGMPPHAAFVIPGILPGMGGPGMAPVDPHLLCDSRHFMTESAQAHAPNQPPGEEGTLGGMVANIMSSLMGQQNPHTHPPQGQQQAGSTATSSTTTSSARAGPQVGGQPFNPFANLFGSMQPPQPGSTQNTQTGRSTRTSTAPAANATTGATDTTGTAGATAQPGGQEPAFIQSLRQFLQEGQQQRPQGEQQNNEGGEEGEVTDEMFTQLVRGISNYVAQAALGRPTDTFANFLSGLGQNYNITPSEGLLMDVFGVVAQNLTFTDIMAIFYGQPTPLQSLQGPLRTMVQERVLQGSTATDDNIEQAVERIMTDLTPEINQACENAQGRDDIDFHATLMEFARHHLRVSIRFIMQSSSADPEFGQHLYTLCQRVVHEFVVLGAHCLQGRERDLQRLIEQQMRHISRGVNPPIQQWMVSIPVREMTHILNEANIPVSDLENYIRRTGPMETSPVPSEGSFMSAESAEFCDPMTEDPTLPATTQQATEAMEIDSPAACVGAGNATSEAVSSASILEAQKKLPPPPTADPQDEVNVVIGSETWHREVPQEWVPVIARDTRRQSRESHQAPFSDAYLHGMPAKRRKLAEKKNEQELTNLNSIVPETLRRAVVAAGAETLSSLDEVTEEASASISLHNAFERQVCESVRERINNDPDFSAEKFPNANKFFKKEK